MKKAVVYARYSCDNQTEQSIEGQLRVCEEYAKNNDILILNTYIDRAMTGTNDLRPDFQRMLKDSKNKQWDYVLVYKLDRFSRNKYESVLHKKTLKENGVKVISAMENIPDTPEGIILESLLEGMNQYYSAELAQKVKRGMHETRLKGYFQGGTLLYGYKLDGRKIVVDEEQAEIVRYIYKQYSLGIFVKTIIKTLTEKGVLYKGKPLARNTVYGILKNEKYSGKYMHEEEIVDNMYPQIVPTELFQKVRDKISKNKYGKKSVKTTYLLRGKLKCGYCGLPIIAESGTTRHGKTIHYYKCSGRKNKLNNCQKSVIQKEILEKFVLDNVINQLKKQENMNAIVKGLLEIQDKSLNENRELSIMQKQKKQLENTLNNIMSAIEKGVVTKTTANRLKEVESQLEELEKKILIEKNKLSVKIPESIIRQYYSVMLELEPLPLINNLIKEIKLYDDKIEVTFNSPIKTSPDENQGFLFYSKTHKILFVNQNQNICEMRDIVIKLFV
ncbi:MAG: recombinase family protein [Candidatus Caccovivens sp.]